MKKVAVRAATGRENCLTRAIIIPVPWLSRAEACSKKSPHRSMGATFAESFRDGSHIPVGNRFGCGFTSPWLAFPSGLAQMIDPPNLGPQRVCGNGEAQASFWDRSADGEVRWTGISEQIYLCPFCF